MTILFHSEIGKILKLGVTIFFLLFFVNKLMIVFSCSFNLSLTN